MRQHLRLMVVLVLLGPYFATASRAEEKPGDRMIDAYLAAQTAKLSQRVFDGATTLEEWKLRRPRLKQEYFDMLGLWPLPPRTPLHATITGTLDRGHVRIEKLHFQSRPGLYVTANLYRPQKIEGKLPAVLYVCGHSGRGRDGNKTAFQDHGLWFANHGYVCLILDTLQLGEIPGVHHGTYSRGRWWWQALGYTPAGVECWNGIRGIDYLVSRPEVDAERIAVTGISGGGAATFWIAAADQRVKCAVPVSGMSDLESYVSHKVINGHCDCMFLVNTYAWEWTTIAALVAPRPLLFCNSDHDPIFPMDGNKRIIARLRKLYQLYGKPELFDAYVSHGGHDYRPDLRIAIFKWINKHLKKDTGPVEDANFPTISGKELRVFPEDKDLPKDAINGRIDETFVSRAHATLPEPGKFDEWKRKLIRRLREQCFRQFPTTMPTAKLERRHEDLPGNVCAIERIIPEPGIELLGGPVRAKGKIRTLLVLGEEGLGEKTRPGAWAQFIKGRNYWQVFLRGTYDEWTKKSPPNYVARAHALLGRTVDSGRVLDIIATARYLKEREKEDITVIGIGQSGILAAYAALFEPCIQEVVIIDPPTSHRQGPIFLNVLRVLDIPEALGLLAPRKLTLVHARDKAFERTAEIYKRAGAADKFARK
ncbi:MAG TPA: prolyl oligopeptidase family serine peptidase [Gemmataceae bacterium]|nr:prolyl oligopeptidase family serine peptidase [Gemmataceae bacterium]